MDYMNVARCFGILHRRSQAFVVDACQKLHLTYSEYVMLLRIYGQEGCSQEDMAAQLHVDKAVVTRVIKLLEEKNFIYREKDSTDRRIKRIYLTELGRSQEGFLKDVVNRWGRYLSSGMKPEVVTVLLEGFQDLAERSGTADFNNI